MDLTTQCPLCNSVFPVSLEQLQLRKGYIRCIGCAHIFDGYEAVVPNGSAPGGGSVAAGAPGVVRHRSLRNPVSGVPAATPPAVPAARPFTIPLSDPSSHTDVHAPKPAAGGRPEPVIPAAGSFITAKPEPQFRATQEPEQESAGRPAGISAMYAEPRSGLDAGRSAPDFLDDGPNRQQSGYARVFWRVLVLLGLVAALGQLTYVYRSQIASAAPVLRPLLERACGSLKCTVGYPRHIQHISIMDSSLQAAPSPNGAQKDGSQMVLRVVLRNRYDKPQEWPTLSLDLVGFSGGIAARRILPPSAYLPAQILAGPFAAKSEMNITVPVTVAGIKINGYQLGKFFP